MRRARLPRGALLAVAGAGVAALLAIGTATVTTRQGVNYQVSTRELPLYAKALGFLDRHVQYRLLARQITRGGATDSDRLLAVFDWTRAHIRPTPADWPVIDDHIWHIIVRGHGQEDQMADVFTTLCTYAKVPAFWRVIEFPDGERGVLSFARVDGAWAVVDVANGLVFRRASGALASLEELQRDPQLVRTTAGARRLGGRPYGEALAQITLRIPRTLRAHLQMPGPRLWYELRRLTGAREAVPQAPAITLANANSNDTR
jgi:hypothetical protein